MLKDENLSNKTQAGNVDSNSAVVVKKPSAFRRFVKKHPVATTIMVSVILLAGLYFFMDIQADIEKKALTKSANIAIKENDETMLMVLSKSVVWSIRSEMLRGNIEQVDLLISDLVKENNFQYIHIVETTGNVLLSTNKKLEGQPVQNTDVVSNLNADKTVIINAADSTTILVSPVMGYDSRLGTMVLCYRSRIL